MFYLKVTVTVIAIIYTLYVLGINVFTRFKFAVNKVYSLVALATLGMLISLLLQLVFPNSDDLILYVRIYFALIILINQLFFHYTQIFPRWEKRTPAWGIFLSVLPGLPVAGITLVTDYVVSGVTYGEVVAFQYGEYFYVYLIAFGFYILGTFLNILWKTRVLENESFRYQLFYKFMGNHVGALFIVVTFLLMPYVFHNFQYHALGIPVAAIILNVINLYATSDERIIDFKGYYLQIGAWALTIIFLLVPAYMILEAASLISGSGENLPSLGVALAVFAYFFIFFRVVHPRIISFFRRDYIRLERNFNMLIQEFSQISEISEEQSYWDAFFTVTIDRLCDTFGIESAALYLYNEDARGYIFSHSYGESFTLRKIGEGDILPELMTHRRKIIDRSILYTDSGLLEYRSSALDLMKQNGIHVLIPCYNQENELVAILCLGHLISGKPYSYNLLSVLDLYRIQLGNTLSNALQIENVKTEQVDVHDRMVVSAIKKRIIPTVLPRIRGIRISSFYMDNSSYGGDYYDAVELSPDMMALIMADTTDAGVESSLLGLQLYSAFHSISAGYDSPEKILHMMNWVVSTSQYSEMYANANCIVFHAPTREIRYVNAAFSPLILFDGQKDNYIELDTKGVPLGIERDFIYESRTYKAGSSTIGFLYSNGFNTAINAEGVSYAVGRIKDIIRINKEESPAILVRKIVSDLRNFVDDRPIPEDVSLVVFRLD